MTTELPYEIWFHILSYLDAETIQQLRFVNTLLYNLSLDAYNKITQIGFFDPFCTNAPLRDRRNARRARKLIIRRGPIYPQDYEPSQSRLGCRWSIWKPIKAKFSPKRQHVGGDEQEIHLDKLLDAAQGLTTLSTLDVSLPFSLDDHSFYWTKLAVINAAWPVFAVNLTTLSLDMPLEEIHFISLSDIKLFRLENFSTVLHTFHRASEPNELIRNSLFPFFTNNGATLRSLKLEAFDKVDMSSILTGLQRMPCLNSLHLSSCFISLTLTSLIGHHQFLEAHQSQLQHLTFNFVARYTSSNVDMSEFFNQEWCRVPLPELQSLSFGLLRFAEVSCEDAAIPYFQRHIPAVKSLTILALRFSYDQVASILKGPNLGEYQFTTSLRMLDIQIWCFSPEFLSLLVHYAPHLQSLKLNACIVGPDKQPEHYGRNRVPEFCEALQQPCYCFPEWGLYDLELVQLPPSLRNQCKVALFRALPKLRTFCGSGPEESWVKEQEMEMTFFSTLSTQYSI